MNISLKILFCILKISILCSLVSCTGKDNNTYTEIPFSYTTAGDIVIKGNVNGEEENFILYTSFDDVLLHAPSTEHDEGYYYLVNGLYLNDKFIPVEVVIMNTVLDGIPYGYGLLGIKAFSGYWMEMSFTENKIKLYKSKPDNYIEKLPAKTELDQTPGIDFGISVSVEINQEEIFMPITTYPEFSFRFPYYCEDFLQDVNIVKVFDETLRIKRDTIELAPVGGIGLEYLKNFNILFDLTNYNSGKTTYFYYERGNDL
ncbi:MAG: hypothetical protein LBM77_08665 [Spirochaetaceae bacterium]|jgi:hypothetical protein|nr:hypothetical protein [Spirochaetaceae bacterium]